jgi:FkbM family methyltransferase
VVAQTSWDDSLFQTQGPVRHKARPFAALPGPDEAKSLLTELAAAPCVFAPAVADRPLALYGAGNLGRLARDFLKVVGRDIAFVADHNARNLTPNEDWDGTVLLHPDAVAETTKRRIRLAVAIVTTPYVAIEDSLWRHGFDDIVPFYDLAESFRYLHPLSNGWFATPLTPEDQDRTARVLTTWADDRSRAHHLQFLAWRRLREEWIFDRAPVSMDDRFFIPEIATILREDETFVDAGAHYGDVIDAFLRRTGGKFQRIAAIEPDPANRARLRKRPFARESRVAIYDCALSDRAGEVRFHDGLDYASQISQTGKLRVAARPLDTLGVPQPTFIKIHIEGGELNALKGARRLLQASRPIVAATVYHNADGIWRTPLWLMDNLPDYRFLFRAHSWCGTGAVVYAIPNERAAP